jgi:hypothetical protein
MHALHQEILAPSGVEFAAWLKLTTGKGPEEEEGVLSNVVVARSNLLRVFELRKITADKEHYKFYHIRTHRLHGIVTGLEGVRVLGSLDDGRDRLLVAFKDAKVCTVYILGINFLLFCSDRPPRMVTSSARSHHCFYTHVRTRSSMPRYKTFF